MASSRYERLLLTILTGRSDANIEFNDLRNLLLDLGFEERTRGSHHLFRKPGIHERINIQRDGHLSQNIPSPPDSGSYIEASTKGVRMMPKYEIILYWSEEDLVFVAEVPELSGCMAHGDSHEAALINVKDAIQLWIETAQEFGDPVPEPKGRRLMLA